MAIASSSVDNFPRSDGAKQFKKNENNSSFAKDDQLFKKKRNLINPKQALRINRKKISVKNEPTSAPTKLNKVVVENMTLSRLVEDMSIYGCIQEIDDFEIKFSITGGIIVKVPITNVSTPYSKLIEDFASDNVPENIEIAKLSAIFQIGDYYPVKILSKKLSDQFGHKEIIGSINPKDIYNFTSKLVQNLPDGYNIIAAVSSFEDYGYEMDIGVEGTKAFLPTEDLIKNQNDSKLYIGQLVRCSISQKDERSVILSTSKKHSNFSFDDEHEPSVYSYVPGITTKCTVTDVHNSGLELALPGGYRGFVSRYHLSDDILAIPKNFKIGDTLQGYVLYVQPHTKQVCVSLKSKLSKKTVRKIVNSLIRPGLVIKDATICGFGQIGSTIFKLPTNDYAVASRKNLCEPSEYENLKLNGHFSIGTTHLCRVKTFHLFDNVIEISLKKSFIERKELSFEDLSVGAIVTGTVKKLKQNGIYVRLGFGLNGFIPNMHLTDAPMVNLGKNREKLFAEKKQIKCRITRLDTNARVPKISLTMKKTLLNMEESEVFSNYDDIQPGSSSTGVVCLVNQKGVLLEFFGRVTGFIPVKYLATYKIEHPEKVFALGQLIKCTVISVDKEAQRMVCSLINVNETKKLKIKANLTEKKLQNASLQVGQILKKMKVISKVAMKGLDLTNQKQDIQVFLPLAHLSDDTNLSRLLYAAFKVGQVIEQVMVFSVDSSHVVTVTRKNSFLQSTDKLVFNESDIQMNRPFPVIIRNVVNSGVFFETPNFHYGVVRRKQLQDGFYEDPQKLDFVKGQTIYVSAVDFAHIGDKNEKNKSLLSNFKFSMKLSDVWNREPTAKEELMKSYINDFSLALQLFKSKEESDLGDQSNEKNLRLSLAKLFTSYSIGQVVTYRVTNITGLSIEVKISLTGAKSEQTIDGFANKYADFEELNIGQMGNAIVCDFDFERRALLVFIQPQPARIVKHVKNAHKLNAVKNVKVDQTIKGTIIHTGQRFVLASLSGHAPGVIAYIPSRRHRNDFGQIEKLFTVGEAYHFLIRQVDEDGRVIAILKTDAQKTEKSNSQKKEIIVDKSQRGQNERKTQSNLKNDTLISEPMTILSNSEPSKNIKVESVQTSQNDFQWDIPDLTPNLSKKRKIEDLKQDDGNSDSDTHKESNANKKPKSREERNEDARQRELQLRQKENELCDLERTPQNEQDYEMAVVASPNSSLIWLKYMSFYLESGDTAKAREVAERALQRISFREEKEKLNIWIGLMNLENTYGDPASMDALLEKAIKYNDSKTIYLQLASIYDNSNKKEKAEQIHHLTLKKFKQDKFVWIAFLVFYMQNGRLESARKLFQKALLSLEKRDHVDLISKFAQLEFRYGDPEQGKTIFESMLATYWKRLDQWSIYIDMLVKYTLGEEAKTDAVDGVEFVRNIFERLITFKLPPQKMKFIFKKYYDFEAKFSAENSEILDKIKQKALEYIESDIF